MEAANDNGADWRIRLQRELTDLEVFWLDPTHKPTNIGIEDEQTKYILNDLRSKGDYKLLRQMIQPIRSYDLRMVDISDFLVVHLDRDTPTCGTWEELFLANRQKKPVVLHYAQGKGKVPHWLFDVVPEQMMFSEWFEVFEYLRHIAYGTNIDDLNRWKFFDLSLCRTFNDE
ncbi:MAG: hypothetical protein WC942_02480 [Clostridia bacterium]|jgi:hypothetical protein